MPKDKLSFLDYFSSKLYHLVSYDKLLSNKPKKVLGSSHQMVTLRASCSQREGASSKGMDGMEKVVIGSLDKKPEQISRVTEPFSFRIRSN